MYRERERLFRRSAKRKEAWSIKATEAKESDSYCAQNPIKVSSTAAPYYAQTPIEVSSTAAPYCAQTPIEVPATATQFVIQNWQ